MSKDPRELTHGRVPLVSSQIAALTATATEINRRIDKMADDDRSLGGLISAANMLAGFAAELGLKKFSMTYAQEVPKGHNLKMLYDGLPSLIQEDISVMYLPRASHVPNLRMIAFTSSSSRPDPPTQTSGFGGWRTIGELLETSARSFEDARYFYERVKSGEWLILLHVAPLLVSLGDVLQSVYDAYAVAGGYGPEHLRRPLGPIQGAEAVA